MKPSNVLSHVWVNGCAITQACQVEFACVWKRSALYVILQSSFVSRVQPTKCLSSDGTGILFFEGFCERVHISDAYQKITIPHTLPSHRYTRVCELHTYLTFTTSCPLEGNDNAGLYQDSCVIWKVPDISCHKGQAGPLFTLSHSLIVGQKTDNLTGNDVW